jgi:hypothetical protein
MTSNDDLVRQLDHIGRQVSKLQTENERLRDERDGLYELAVAMCTIADRWFKVSGDPDGHLRGEVRNWREQIARTVAESEPHE